MVRQFNILQKVLHYMPVSRGRGAYYTVAGRIWQSEQRASEASSHQECIGENNRDSGMLND